MQKQELETYFATKIKNLGLSRAEQKKFCLKFASLLAEIDSSNNKSYLAVDFGTLKSSIDKVGYMGVEGAFAHEALIKYFGPQVGTIPYASFAEVFQAIKSKKIDYGVLPLENSSTGSINDNYDLLREYGLYIVGEYNLNVNQNLLGVSGAKLEDIKVVYSHPQALMQCKSFLEKEVIQPLNASNTAVAAKLVAEKNDKSIGAVASAWAAELYQLVTIKEQINDNKGNKTRFIIVGDKLLNLPVANQVSIVFTLPHEAGKLYNVLKIFAEHDINISRIESRPIVGEAWHYYFYIDLEGNLIDSEVLQALQKVKDISTTFRILGNYKKATD